MRAARGCHNINVVTPEHVVPQILRYVAEDLGPDTYVDLMAQYYPAGLVGKPGRDSYEEIDRHLHRSEYEQAAALAESLGLQRLDRRSLSSGLLLGER